MQHGCVFRTRDDESRLHQRELQIRVLAPRRRKARIEAARTFECGARDEGVRRREFGAGESGGVAFVIGRAWSQRHDDAARHGIRARIERTHAIGDPVRIGNGVVVGEGDAPREDARQPALRAPAGPCVAVTGT